jgi:hypothetical protein
MKTRVDLERILRRTDKGTAKGKLKKKGVVVVDKSNDDIFSAGQRVRVLVDTRIPVMNSITGEQIGHRKQSIGNGTVQIRNSQVYVVMDDAHGETRKICDYRFQPSCVAQKKHVTSARKAKKSSREVYVQKILE